MTRSAEQVETLIVGAGQAGLATSHELTRHGVAHVVLERGHIGQAWRERWGSFALRTIGDDDAVHPPLRWRARTPAKHPPATRELDRPADTGVQFWDS